MRADARRDVVVDAARWGKLALAESGTVTGKVVLVPEP